MKSSIDLKADMDLQSAHARLQQLERGEWYRWGAALIIPIVLTMGLLALSLPISVNDSLSSQKQLELTVHGLLALVLLFDAFVVYQQVMITRLRRQLTSQLGLIAALDLIKHPKSEETQAAEAEAKDRRRLVRAHFDQQLKVRSMSASGKEVVTHGRIRDITEHGIGAVVPVALNPGDQVTLEFTADGCLLALKAAIVHRRGFRYGMEFVALAEPAQDTLRRIRLQQLATAPAN
jgi:hypothetical protein